MVQQSLNGIWQLKKIYDPSFGISANVPGSVYTALLEAGQIEDPYVGENQYGALKHSEWDYSFSLDFSIDDEIMECDKILLHFDGIDTDAEICYNGNVIGKCDNMHREWEFDITKYADRTSQKLEVKIFSPITYINQRNTQKPLWGVSSTMAGYPHIRKAHYMYGWDWGPVLPDMGIWRDVSIIGIKGGRIESVYNHQLHMNNTVLFTVDVNVTELSLKEAFAAVELIGPDGERYTEEVPVSGNGKVSVDMDIREPKKWYPRGYGDQPLYTLNVCLVSENIVYDMKSLKIGLREIEICRTPDNDGTDGEEFAFSVNGIKIFAMGANYIPEDQLICRTSEEKTKKLLSDCIAANYNMIRVWGGGIYPENYFYDFCDEHGLLVWQDCMFACSVYSADRAFCENVRHEIIDNVKRLRNHASLAMWCGNNEIESAWQYWGLPEDEELKNGYLRMFEVLIPKVMSYYDPGTFYWPSSPSSGGRFNDSGAKNKGDIHYWEVWHSCKPFTDYNKYLFRFCSEYGFESIPCMKTIRSFAEEKDLNLMSPVMEAHQKCEQGNEKLMYYIAQMMHYPYSFEGLVYATQLVQADAIRLNVENMRRHRGVCMGSLYWQVNDSNPVISWSSIDYFGRWKALHYYARKFYAPVLASVDLTEDRYIKVNVSNERTRNLDAKVCWKIRTNTGEIIREGECSAKVPALTAADCCTLVKDNVLPVDKTAEKKYLRSCYLEAAVIEKGARLSTAVTLFVQPKHFEFIDPKLGITVEDMGRMFRINVKAEAFAKGVCLEMKNHDAVFSDNWFDVHGGEYSVFLNKTGFDKDTTAEDILADLTITSYYTQLGLERYN